MGRTWLRQHVHPSSHPTLAEDWGKSKPAWPLQGSDVYQLRDDAQLVSEAGLRSMITPDQWCAYWSMLAGGAASLYCHPNICAVSFSISKCRRGPVPFCGAPTFNYPWS